MGEYGFKRCPAPRRSLYLWWRSGCDYTSTTPLTATGTGHCARTYIVLSTLAVADDVETVESRDRGDA